MQLISIQQRQLHTECIVVGKSSQGLLECCHYGDWSLSQWTGICSTQLHGLLTIPCDVVVSHRQRIRTSTYNRQNANIYYLKYRALYGKSFYRTLIGNHTQSIEWYHFQ